MAPGRRARDLAVRAGPRQIGAAMRTVLVLLAALLMAGAAPGPAAAQAAAGEAAPDCPPAPVEAVPLPASRAAAGSRGRKLLHSKSNCHRWGASLGGLDPQ